MTQRYKVGDVVQEGKIEADRVTKWADGTTTYSYLTYVTEDGYCGGIRQPKFKVGDKVQYDSRFSVHTVNKVSYEVYHKVYIYCLDGAWGTFTEDQLTAWVEPIPKPKFKVGDKVCRIGGVGTCQEIVSAEYRKGLLGGLFWRYNTRTNAGYREDELTAWVAPVPKPKFKVGDKVQFSSGLGTYTVNHVSYDVSRKWYTYNIMESFGSFTEDQLTLFVAPLTKKGCEHFRETEFVVIAQKRTIVKNKFCPDCGKRIR